MKWPAVLLVAALLSGCFESHKAEAPMGTAGNHRFGLGLPIPDTLPPPGPWEESSELRAQLRQELLAVLPDITAVCLHDKPNYVNETLQTENLEEAISIIFENCAIEVGRLAKADRDHARRQGKETEFVADLRARAEREFANVSATLDGFAPTSWIQLGVLLSVEFDVLFGKTLYDQSSRQDYNASVNSAKDKIIDDTAESEAFFRLASAFMHRYEFDIGEPCGWTSAEAPQQLANMLAKATPLVQASTMDNRSYYSEKNEFFSRTKANFQFATEHRWLGTELWAAKHIPWSLAFWENFTAMKTVPDQVEARYLVAAYISQGRSLVTWPNVRPLNDTANAPSGAIDWTRYDTTAVRIYTLDALKPGHDYLQCPNP